LVAMNKLYRSRRDRKLFGLCGGLSDYLNVDPTLLRLVVVVTTFFSAGTVVPIYVIASVVIPKEPNMDIPPVYPPHGGYGAGYPYNGAPTGAGFGGAAYAGGQRPVHQAGPVNTQPNASHLDEMMKDIEKKALYKELEELRAKVAKYEKGDE